MPIVHALRPFVTQNIFGIAAHSLAVDVAGAKRPGGPGGQAHRRRGWQEFAHQGDEGRWASADPQLSQGRLQGAALNSSLADQVITTGSITNLRVETVHSITDTPMVSITDTFHPQDARRLQLYCKRLCCL